MTGQLISLRGYGDDGAALYDLGESSEIVQFAGFEDVVDCSRVRKASSYLEQLHEEFAPKAGSVRVVDMFSTKLRGKLAFRKGELTCWAGYSGHRKSMFSGQVALDIISQKQRVLIASFEMLPSATLARMARQVWGKEKPTPDELTRFASWANGRLWLFDHFGKITPSKVLALCRFFASEKMGHHVFIDSLMMVCESEEHFDEQKRFMTNLVRVAQETGLHIHLVVHCRKPAHGGDDKPPTKYDVRGTAAISDQAFNVVTIWANQAKKGKAEPDATVCDAYATVEKQRNGKWEGRCQLWFDESSLRFCDDGVSAVHPYASIEGLS